MIASVRADRFTLAQPDLIVEPRVWNKPQPVVLCNGLNGLVGGFLDSTGHVVKALADEHFVQVAPDLIATWGNSKGATYVVDAINYAVANLGVTDEKIALLGVSMGGGAATLWAAQNPDRVSAVVLLLPALDYQTLRVNNPLFNIRASIDAAFSVTYPAALPAGANPSTLTANLQGIPFQIWTASDDPISINHATFEAAIGAQAYDVGATGHGVTSLLAVDATQVASFISHYAESR